MRKFVCLFALVLASCAATACAVEVSTKNNIGGYMEYGGFSVNPVHDIAPATRPGDLSNAQLFEVSRPGMQAFTIGRLYASCTCFQAETDKKSYGYGERAFITLHNVQPTKGQMYPFYIQITSPINVILRCDTYIISDQFTAAGTVAQSADVINLPTPQTSYDFDGAFAAMDAELSAGAGKDAPAVTGGNDFVLSDTDLGN